MSPLQSPFKSQENTFVTPKLTQCRAMASFQQIVTHSDDLVLTDHVPKDKVKGRFQAFI